MNAKELISRLSVGIKSTDWAKVCELAKASGIKVHLAIFREPFLSFILDGQKTIESRFSQNRCSPYNQVGSGDIILLKKTGGPITGFCVAKEVKYYQLTPEKLIGLRKKYSPQICAQDNSFWQERSGKSFATLIWIEKPTSIEPFHIPKRDRRGWVTL